MSDSNTFEEIENELGVSLEEDFSELIPNSAGLPCQETNSEAIRKEHTMWKKEIREKKDQKSIEGLSYWHTVSSCVAL